MKLELICAWRNLLKLARFLVLYAGGVVLLFYLAPLAASFAQASWESMSAAVKLGGLVLFVLGIAAWHWRSVRVERNGAPPVIEN